MTDLSFARGLAVKQQRADNTRSNISDFGARPFFCNGQFLLKGVGEVVKDVSFPVMFTEKPLLSIGADLDDNVTITAGNFPTISGIVLRYDKTQPNSQSFWYRGASLIIVTTGDPSTNMWVHWEFKGMALVNPISATSTTTDSI